MTNINSELETRRHDDGSIDIDFYRQRALRLRTETMTVFFTGKFAKPLIAILVLIVAVAVLPRHKEEDARRSASIISKSLLNASR